MYNARRNSKKVIASVVMALLMIMAMAPGMAFADSNTGPTTVTIDGVAYTTTVTVNSPGIVIAGTAVTMPAVSTTTNYTGTTHVDWSITNGTGAATINKHQGQITATTAGVVYVTATLRTGEAVSGGGTQTPCTGTILDTYTYDLTIAPSTAYGFQGTGGNSMMMTTPSNITGSIDYDAAGTTIISYSNVINGALTLTATGTFDFGFTMSAGVNNFSPSNFMTNSLPHIQILDPDYQPITGASVTMDPNTCFDPATKTITITANGLTAGNSYILQFGADVCGNNVAKKLGVPVNFQFTAQ